MLWASDDAAPPVSAYTITAYQHGKQPRTLQLVGGVSGSSNAHRNGADARLADQITHAYPSMDR